MELEVDNNNNAERKIVPSSEVITRNSFKGKPNNKEVQEPTTNAKVANNLNSNSKQTKIYSFMNRK